MATKDKVVNLEVLKASQDYMDGKVDDLKSAVSPVINQDNIFGDPQCKDDTVYTGTSTDNYRKWKFLGINADSVAGTDYSNAYKFTKDGTNKPYLLQDFWPSDLSAGTYHIAFLIKASVTSQYPSFGGTISFTGYPTINNSSGTSIGSKSVSAYTSYSTAGTDYYLYETDVTITSPASYHHVRLTIYFNTTSVDIWVAEPYLSTGGVYTPVGEKIRNLEKSIVSKLYQKSLYADGDSIAYGAGAEGVSYVDLLAEKYSMTADKQAVSGGTMAYVADKHCIASSVVDHYNGQDFVLLEGGYNDYGSSVTIGALPTSSEQPITPSPDTDTFIGGMEVAFQHIMNANPTAKIYYLIPHHIYKSTVKPINDKTFQDFVDAIKLVCGRYGVEIISIYDNVNMHTYLDIYKPYTYNSDTVHPTLEGYTYFYLPYIEKIMA